MEIELTTILHRLLPAVEWVMNDNDINTLQILTPDIEIPTLEQIKSMRETIENEFIQAQNQKQSILNRLGITEEEAKLLLS